MNLSGDRVMNRFGRLVISYPDGVKHDGDLLNVFIDKDDEDALQHISDLFARLYDEREAGKITGFYWCIWTKEPRAAFIIESLQGDDYLGFHRYRCGYVFGSEVYFSTKGAGLVVIPALLKAGLVD